MPPSGGGHTPLKGRVVLITGAARRIGHALALASARAGADVVVHYSASKMQAEATRAEIISMGSRAWCLQADLARPDEAVRLAREAFQLAPIYGLVNNAAIFASGDFEETSLSEWESHLCINLTAPFLLTQEFSRLLGPGAAGRVVNLLDFRATQPGADHFAYTISKAGLAAMTRSLALALAPRVSINGLALGAILPPGDAEFDPGITARIPARRWGHLDEVGHALIFLLAGPAYVTGEVIYLDGGRHLL